ncbi:MAG: uncharacterized membrane protein YjfL (UPF0719 family) [Alphaproteobacteria bacterium]|jgi:uncharacterized membrane protein YjfL (UPF0719 family)
MDQLINLVPISNNLGIYLVIDIVIAIVMLVVIRWLSGLFSKISVRQELGERDNFAFGISLAGRIVSLAIVLSAVVGRYIGMGFEAAAMGMLMFGGLGILLVKIGRYARDKLVHNRLDKNQMIQDKNVSVALVDACASIASAIIIKSIIEWSVGIDMNAFIAVFSGVLVVLTVLLFATRVYEYIFAKNNQNSSFQKTLCNGQLALAIQHGGNLIGIAIAVSTASKVLIYSPAAYVSNITGWLIVGLAFAFSLMVLANITKRIVMVGVSWRREVALQHNIGIASVEAASSIGIALLFHNVFS